MPLSEYEQRVLDELERDLGTDAKLNRSMTRAPRSSARVAVAVAAVAIGLSVAIWAVSANQPVFGVIAFGAMIGVVLWSLLGSGGRASTGAPAKGAAPKGAKKNRKGFVSRLEERHEKRREQGDL